MTTAMRFLVSQRQSDGPTTTFEWDFRRVVPGFLHSLEREGLGVGGD